MTTTRITKIGFDFESNGGKLNFNSIEDVQHWINEEDLRSKWLLAACASDGNLNRISSGIISTWTNARNTVNLLLLPQHAHNHEAHLNNLINSLNSAFRSNQLLHSSRPEFKFCEQFASVSPKAAAYAVGYFLRISGLASTSIDMAIGVNKAILFETGLFATCDGERAALEALRAQGQRDHEIYRDIYENLKLELDALCIAGNENENIRSKEHSSRMASENQRINVQVEETKSRFKSLEQAYNEHMTLKAPVDYWQKRAGDQLRIAIGSAIAAGSIVVLGMLALFFLYVISNTSDGMKASFSGNTVTADVALLAPTVVRTAFVVLCLSFLIWAVRLLVRMFINSFIISTDASERVTMVKTFLALIQDEKATAAEDRHLILQALFRSSDSTFFPDDASPPYPHSVIAGLGKK